ncbi:aspartyl/asparaginyl beta-hydroxylase domain-containing protein [Sphingomonas sp.]|uniref:aspartyl/asparaginyl beta-hydroxylase domain-containing protein n=1 Tax=Sphingomonas sp. TaxID=28214 RepID=UPI003864F1A0
MMIFDDSIEHEAWNDSDKVRVVLLFEIWRPEISERERAALTAMFAAVGDF